LRFLKNLVYARGKILLTAGNLRELCDRRLDVRQDRTGIRTDLSEDRSQRSLLLLKHRRQKMFRLDLLVLIFFGNADGVLNRFLPANCKSVKSHSFIIKLNREARRRGEKY